MGTLGESEEVVLVHIDGLNIFYTCVKLTKNQNLIFKVISSCA